MSRHPNPHCHVTNSQVTNTMNRHGVFDVKLGFDLFDELFALIDSEFFVTVISQLGDGSSVVMIAYPTFESC